jgi:hypothetical protein
MSKAHKGTSLLCLTAVENATLMRASRGLGGAVRSRRTAADDDQAEPLENDVIVILLALKLRAASKHS